MALLGIRADGDAGAEAGMGHVYRSVAYARALQRETPNLGIRFYMRDFPEGLRKIREEGFEISVLPPRPSRRDFEKAFTAFPPDVLIIDTLGSTPDLISAARGFSRAIITIDDVEESAADADAIVNGILWGTRRLPQLFGKATVYQGAEYIQLRESFAEANRTPRTIRSRVETILISTGGADGRGFTLQLMAALRELPFSCRVSVIAGPAYGHLPELHCAAEEMSGLVRFAVVENATAMAQELSSADIALITGGTVMFESAACGTPAVIACSYEHQAPQAERFAEHGLAVNLGYFPEQIDLVGVTRAIADLAKDTAARERMSNAGKREVDGRGLERFVKIVRHALETEEHQSCSCESRS